MRILLALLFIVGCTSMPTSPCPEKSGWVAPTQFPLVTSEQSQQMRAAEKKVMSAQGLKPTLIRGQEVPLAQWPEVKMVASSEGSCSGTIVGPRALVTAAHCAPEGGTMQFKVGTTVVTGVATNAPLYETQDLDINLLYLDHEVASFKPATVAPIDSSPAGSGVQLMGYGCIQEGGGGGNDGILRTGFSKIAGFSGFDVVVKTDASGPALCFGDSGGPGWTKDRKLAWINSKGNIKDTSYLTRLDTKEAYDFMRSWAATNHTDICGVTKDCGGGTQPVCPTSYSR